MHPANDQKEVRVAILISGQIDFRVRNTKLKKSMNMKLKQAAF